MWRLFQTWVVLPATILGACSSGANGSSSCSSDTLPASSCAAIEARIQNLGYSTHVGPRFRPERNGSREA